MRFLTLITVLVWLLVTTGTHADTLTWSDQDRRVDLTRYLDYLIEPPDGLGIEQIRALPPSAWMDNHAESINFGYGEEVFWFRLTINPGSQTLTPLLEIAYPVLDRIDAFLVRGGGVVEHQVLGDKLPFHQRPVHHRNFLLPLALTADEPLQLYLRVETTSSMQVPMTLWDEAAFHASDQAGSIAEGLYFGIILVMILYNLFVYLAVGERSFLYYVGYITAMPLFLASLRGLSFQYLWPEATWWNDQAIVAFLNLVIVFGAVFTMRFLTVVPRTHPRLSVVTIAAIAMAGLLVVASVLLPYRMLIVPTITLATLTCSLMLFLGVYRWWHRDTAARYYTGAWVFMLSGGIVLALSKFTMLPRNVFTENATQLGSALGVILLSIALADRLNREKRAAFQAQQRLLREERKVRLTQERSLRIQQQANAQLEERVQERTRDLERLNAQLLELSSTDALTGLKNRAHFDSAFQSACVRAYRFRQPLSVLVVDIDHFKQFNDTYGHLVGDDCLQSVAEQIRQIVTRPQDLAARYGGEEFVVLLPDTPEAGAVRVAERIRKVVEQAEFRVSDDRIRLSVSIGVATLIPDHAEQTKELFERADAALYRAKAQGRNRVQVERSPQADPVVTSIKR